MPELIYIAANIPYPADKNHPQNRWVTVETYEAACHEARQEAPTVFIFPGNNGQEHHGPSATLYAIKSGGGLGHAARILGEAGYPVLSLPTMVHDAKGETLEALAPRAIADLYRALGAGYHLMLPVRPFNTFNKLRTRYFSAPLEGPDNVEPSFWGDNCKTANRELSDTYRKAIDQIQHFLNKLNQFGEAHALSTLPESFQEAYLAGKLSLKHPNPWFQKNPASSCYGDRGARQGAAKNNSFFSTSHETSPADILAGVLCLAGTGFLIAALISALPMVTGLIISGSALALSAAVYTQCQPIAKSHTP